MILFVYQLKPRSVFSGAQPLFTNPCHLCVAHIYFKILLILVIIHATPTAKYIFVSFTIKLGTFYFFVHRMI